MESHHTVPDHSCATLSLERSLAHALSPLKTWPSSHDRRHRLLRSPSVPKQAAVKPAHRAELKHFSVAASIRAAISLRLYRPSSRIDEACLSSHLQIGPKRPTLPLLQARRRLTHNLPDQQDRRFRSAFHTPRFAMPNPRVPHPIQQMAALTCL